MVPRRTRRTGSGELTSADSISLPARASAQRQRESRCPRPYSPAGLGRQARLRVLRGPAGRRSPWRAPRRGSRTRRRGTRRSAIEERTRAGAAPAISMPNVSPADSERSVRNWRSVSSPALRPPEASTRVSSAPESQKSRSCEGSMITHASQTLPSSHSRCRMVRARSEDGSKRELSSPSARSTMSSSLIGSRGMRMGKSSSRVRNCFAASSSASSTRSRICRSKCTLQTSTEGGVSTTAWLSRRGRSHGFNTKQRRRTEDERRNGHGQHG